MGLPETISNWNPRTESLLYRVGENSKWELVGKLKTYTTKEEEYLEFLMNNNLIGDNSGLFTVNF